MKKPFFDNLILNLNSISRIAAIENAVQTQELIRKFIDSLRYKTSRKGQFLSIREEKKAVENFIDIFKMRYGEALDVKVEFENDVLECYIPHYTLMTFVENVLYHAFEKNEDTSVLTITAHKSGAVLMIKVKDNGCGFEPDNYFKSINNNPQYGSIASTISRLSFIYSSSDLINISSSNRKGTTVIIKIPL